MDFTQLIPLTKGVKLATTYASDDSISWDWESGTAYPFNTAVIYNGTTYISLRNVPADAGSPDTEPDFWGILTINV